LEFDYNHSFEELAKGQILDSMDKILLGSLRTSLLNMEIVNKGFNIMQGLAAGMVIVYIYIHIIQECQRSEPSMDFWVRTFVHMTISILAIIYLKQILAAIHISGSSIINQMQKLARAEPMKIVDPTIKIDNAGDAAKSIAKGAWDIVTGKAFVNAILNGVSTVAMHLLMALMLIRTYGLFFTTMIEMVVRWIISPLALADIASHGARSQGIAFMKHYFGCYLQIALFYVCAISCMTVQVWINDASEYNMLLLEWALYGTMGSIMASCKNLTKQALG
jgi:hypothetical protein